MGHAFIAPFEKVGNIFHDLLFILFWWIIYLFD